jgi:hypothetical protein
MKKKKIAALLWRTETGLPSTRDCLVFALTLKKVNFTNDTGTKRNPIEPTAFSFSCSLFIGLLLLQVFETRIILLD